jgi:hypothetical protein
MAINNTGVTNQVLVSTAYGSSWQYSVPLNPCIGDTCLDMTSGILYIWLGDKWSQIGHSESSITPKDLAPPTREQLKDHESLRIAWEQYLIIKKLLGV